MTEVITEFSEEGKKQIKELFDEYMEEREELENQCFTIKLLGNNKEKAKGFYALMINGTTYSYEKNIFAGIDNKQFKALKKTKCPYRVIE